MSRHIAETFQQGVSRDHPICQDVDRDRPAEVRA